MAHSPIDAPKLLSQMGTNDLYEHLKDKPVQSKHIARLLLTTWPEDLIPRAKKGKFKLAWDTRSGERKIQSIVDRYAKQHPKKKHAHNVLLMIARLRVLGPRAKKIDQEMLQLFDGLEHIDVAREHHFKKTLRKVLKGKIPVPAPTSHTQKCRDFVDNYPDSDSASQDESESDCDAPDPKDLDRTHCTLCHGSYPDSSESESQVEPEDTTMDSPSKLQRNEPKLKQSDMRDSTPSDDSDSSSSSNNSQTISKLVSTGTRKRKVRPESDEDLSEIEQPKSNCKRKRKPLREDPDGANSSTDTEEPNSKRFEDAQLDSERSCFKFCSHKLLNQTEKAMHLPSFDRFLLKATVTGRLEHTPASDLWTTYKGWIATSGQPLIPRRLFHKCAYYRFCAKRPKNLLTFYGVGLKFPKLEL
jgi:hypothetical protein